MLPEEKARQLFSQFLKAHHVAGGIGMNEKVAKQCALIAVEEIAKMINVLFETYSNDFITAKNYWYQVKEEINKL